MSKLKLQDLIDAMSLQFDDSKQLLDRNAGEIFLISDEDMRLAENIHQDSDLSDLPDWQKETVRSAQDVIMKEGTGKYIQIPRKRQINEYRIMEKFCSTISSERIQKNLYESIRGRGAFRKFKNEVCCLNVENAWYKYYEDELKKIALEWCAANKIEFDE